MVQQVIYQYDCQYGFCDWYCVNFYIWIVVFFGDYFDFFICLVDCMFWYGNVGGRFQCYMCYNVLFVIDVIEDVVSVVVLKILCCDFIVILVVVQCYYVKFFVDFYVFYCIDVYQCMGDVCIQLVKYWFVKFCWYVVCYYCYFCVDGVIFFFQCVYQFVQCVKFVCIGVKEWIKFNLMLVFNFQWNVVYLGQVVVDFDVEFFCQVFFGDCFCCYVYCGFMCGRMFIIMVIVQVVFLFIGVICVFWMKNIFNCVVVL